MQDVPGQGVLMPGMWKNTLFMTGLKNIFYATPCAEMHCLRAFSPATKIIVIYYIPFMGLDRYCTMQQFSILVHDEWGLIKKFKYHEKVFKKGCENL